MGAPYLRGDISTPLRARYLFIANAGAREFRLPCTEVPGATGGRQAVRLWMVRLRCVASASTDRSQREARTQRSRRSRGTMSPVETVSRPTSERRSRRLTPVVVIRLPSPRVPTRLLALARASPPDRPCPRGFGPVDELPVRFARPEVVEGVAALSVSASPRAATVPRSPVGSRRGATPTSVIVSFPRRVPRARPAPLL